MFLQANLLDAIVSTLSTTRTSMSKLLACVALILTCQLQALHAEITTVKIESHPDTASWALHESGRIFASVKSTNSVVEYDLRGKEVRKFDVEPEPGEMIIKGDHLVVACQKPSSVSVIDLKANRVTGKVVLGGKEQFGFFCSKVDNSLVYGFSKTGGYYNGGEIFQIDINAFKVIKRVKLKRWIQSNPHFAAMSADGKSLIARSSGGVTKVSVNEADGEFAYHGSLSAPSGQIQSGLNNRFWTAGKKLFSYDMKSALREFSGSPVTIHPRYNLAASFNVNALKIERFSDAQTLKTIPLAFQDSSKKMSRRTRITAKTFKKTNVLVGFDNSTHVVTAAKNYCHVIDLTALKLPLEPLVIINVPMSVKAQIDEQLAIPLSTIDKQQNDRVKYKLQKAPDGAKLVGNQLTWTPQKKDIGPHTITIAANVNGSDSVSVATINLNVSVNKLILDFQVAGIHVDTDGKHAIAWGPKLDQNSFQRQSARHGTGPTQVAVLDLENQKVIVQQKLAAGVASAVIQKPYAFLTPRSGNVMYRFDALTLGDSKRISLEGKPWSIVPFANKQVGVVLQGRYEMSVVDPTSMKPTKSLPSGNLPRGEKVALEVAPGILSFNSRLLNIDDGGVVMLGKNPNLSLMTPWQSAFGSRPSVELTRKMFGRYVGFNKIRSPAYSQIAKFENQILLSSHIHPVAFTIRQKLESEVPTSTSSRRYKATKYLDMYRLVDGKVLSSTLFDVTTGKLPINFNYKSKNAFALEEKIVYAYDNQVLLLPIDRDKISNASIPLHFTVPQIPILSTEKPQSLVCKATGGRGELQYRLTIQYEGVEVDSKSGTVTIDTPKIWQSYLQRNTPPYNGSFRPRRNRKQPSDEEYEAIFGNPIPAGKTPFVLPIKLAVTDEDAQEDFLLFYAVVHADKKAADQLEAQQAANAETAKNASQERVATANRARIQRNSPRKIETMDRVDDLEKRLRRMEATLKLILEKVDQ